MDKFDAMKIFIEVAKQGSFIGASEQLIMSAPKITRAVAELEHKLGIRLFHRTTRQVQLTQSGQQYLADAQCIIQDLQEIEAKAAGIDATPTGTLTITAPVMFGQLHIMPLVNEYLSKYQNVDVKAHFVDNLSSLLEEQIEVAIRIGHLKDSALFAKKVGEVRRVVVASPQYLEKMGEPRGPSELAEHQIIYTHSFDKTYTWKFHNQGKIEKIPLQPKFQCNQNNASLTAAIQGLGITRLMSYQVSEQVNSGQLKIILEDFEEPPLPVSVVHLEGRRANARVSTFIQLAIQMLKANPHIH